MGTNSSLGSTSFKLVAKGLVELHRLIKDGKGDSTEAECVRDALDLPLKALSDTERERARWLSEDLYSVSESQAPVVPKEMNPQAERELSEASKARQQKEWDRALALFRRWSDCISPARLSDIRGSIWEEAGIQDVATEFYRHAAQIDPSNGEFQASYLHSLAETDLQAARHLARQILADQEKHAPLVVTRAVDIRFNEARNASDAESVQLCHTLIGVLERNLSRIEHEQEVENREPVYTMTLGLLGFCQEHLGNT